MLIPSEDVPQANDIEDVLHAVAGVQAGHSTYGAIAAYLGKVERQGRYYRRAAEILGLIESARGSNHSAITSSGISVLAADDATRRRLLAEAVLKARIFQRVIPFLEAHPVGVTRHELDEFIVGVTEPVGISMIPRRLSTIVGWLSFVGLAEEVGDKVILKHELPEIPAVEYQDLDEPLLPVRYDLSEYQNVAETAHRTAGAVAVMVDFARHERAALSHRHLVDCVAEKVRRSGALPRFNKLVDLSAVVRGSSFLFEMKSTTEQNYKSQFRRAISQLFEYRYLQRAEQAKLVMVLEHSPSRADEWLLDYAVRDRGLLIAWNGNGKALTAAPGCEADLSFLS